MFPKISIPPVHRFQAACWLIVVSLCLYGCAGQTAFRQGNTALASGRFEEGIGKLKDAADAAPENAEYRRAYYTQRDNAVSGLLAQADAALENENFDQADEFYTQALRLNAEHKRAQSGAERVAVSRRHANLLIGAHRLIAKGDIDAAVKKTQQVLAENPVHRRANALLRGQLRQQADQSGKELGLYPKLKASYRTPVSLTFSAATLQQVFESLKLSSGLNYLFDRDVKTDTRVTLAVTNKPVEDVLRLVLSTNQLERRVLDDDTLLIYPNTPAKASEYREMIVRSFYLNNADINKTATLVRTIAKAKDVFVDEKINLLVVRDSAEVVRLAEKLIATQDLREPEVMLELEVMEVSVSKLVEMGVQWPSSVSASITGAGGIPGKLGLSELRNTNSGMATLQFNDPLFGAKLRSQNGTANLLANPRVRVRNKQAAKILIGERVPVITSVATANVGNSEQVNYLDVGLKLDIEPTISIDDEVSMKLALEVSNILETITRASGTQAYRLGTRNTSTILSVRDGQTQVLAGLIQRDERKSNTGVPGLNEVPLVNKLFGTGQDSDVRTEIILLITPHIVRSLDMPGVGMQEFMAGTESAVGAPPIQLGTARPNGAPGTVPAEFLPPGIESQLAPGMGGGPMPPQLPGGRPQNPPAPALVPPALTPSTPTPFSPPPTAPVAPLP
jgi:general secretion pathway protein D